MEYNTEVYEFLDQVSYALSLKFKDKHKHVFSSHFIELFQEKLLNAFEYQKPIQKKVLVKFLTKTHKYSDAVVQRFFDVIDITLYYPLIYD